jgi:hypothetical protein
VLCRILVIAILFTAPLSASAQQRKSKPRAARPEPSVADFAYGNESERQRLDFWQAKSDEPTPVVVLIHGGGWRAGDKSTYNKISIKPFLDAGISVAAINYRFIPQAMEQGVEPPVKACLYDAARALQTIRSKASEWNIDPKRVGATGGSAGACTSLWLALHDDLAKPDSDDPIARESTRLMCGCDWRANISRPEASSGMDSECVLRRPCIWFRCGRESAARTVQGSANKSRKSDAVDQGVLSDRASKQGRPANLSVVPQPEAASTSGSKGAGSHALGHVRCGFGRGVGRHGRRGRSRLPRSRRHEIRLADKVFDREARGEVNARSLPLSINSKSAAHNAIAQVALGVGPLFSESLSSPIRRAFALRLARVCWVRN